VGARLQVQKTKDLDKEREWEAGLPKTTLDMELKGNAKFYDIYIYTMRPKIIFYIPL
jgi:hypothetical protein